MGDKPKALKVTLIMVMAVNGKVGQNKFQNSFEWNSKEDQRQFLTRIKKIGTVIMGSNTFQTINQRPYGKVDSIILTSDPSKFKSQPGIEFMSGNAVDIFETLRNRGLKHVALLGGPTVNSQFFNHQLIDEIFLTIEPVLLLKGINLINDLSDNIKLHLEEMVRIEDSDTILLHYTIKK